jgi:inorganic phosphate transporter, PiT family
MPLKILLIAAVGLLSFANGANDDFKGVATLWGAGSTSYRRALAWGTAFTFLGSLGALVVSSGLAAKFNGSNLVPREVYTQLPFLCAVILGAAGTVLLASRLGLPISTTHALIGALVGAGITAVGASHVHLGTLGRQVVLPLLFSPVASLLLTLAAYPLTRRFVAGRDCVCIDQSVPMAAVAGASGQIAAAAVIAAPPAVRWANPSECDTGREAAHWSVSEALHWLSAATISFARGTNDTPKIVAVLLIILSGPALGDYFLVAAAMALGGLLGAARVAQTMGKRITPMATPEAVGANLASAALVVLASRWALPVSTTHVTTGSVMGIGLLRHESTDWGKVRDIVLSWVATLPLGGALAFLFYRVLMR